MSNTFPVNREPCSVSEVGSKSRKQGDVSDLHAHVGYWLRAVSNHVSYAFKVRVEAQGVTVAEWVVLRALFEREGVKPSELAATIGHTRGAVSKLVERLKSKDLVSVRNDARDGRAQLITLKPSGRRLVPKLAALADENDAEAFGHLEPAQRALLFATLKGLAEHFGLKEAPVD
jgi:DNA-binding MarR family transcriptional regulator